MTNTNVIASSPNINGNIGQCQINKTDINQSSFYVRTVGVDSCSGKIIADSGTYFDASWIVIPLIIVVIIITGAFALRIIVD